MKITGILEGWRIDSVFTIVWGFIYGDTKKRFRDGTWIHTSDVKGIRSMNLKEGDIIETRNSFYKLGKPLGIKEIV